MRRRRAEGLESWRRAGGEEIGSKKGRKEGRKREGRKEGGLVSGHLCNRRRWYHGHKPPWL